MNYKWQVDFTTFEHVRHEHLKAWFDIPATFEHTRHEYLKAWHTAESDKGFNIDA